jgi:type IV pilus assembly protein PilA
MDARTTIAHEHGFSLIELLIVVLVIGILAGIALPLFLGQATKAQDADAKSNARNMVSQVEACYVTAGDFRDANCRPPSDAGLPVGAGRGQVGVEAPAAKRYVITARSESGTDFVIARNDDGELSRSCTRPGVGGCQAVEGRGVW